MNAWATKDEIEKEIFDHYHARTEDIIRVLGRESYLRKPVVIQEVGYIADLWALWDALEASSEPE